MPFHQLATLSPVALAALADTCEALITAEGRETATPRERQLLEELFPALVGVQWPPSAAPTVPANLADDLPDRRTRQEVMQLLTLLTFLEPRLDEPKVSLLHRIAEELGVAAAEVADLEEVCRGHVIKAFVDLYRRTFHVINHEGLTQGFARFLLPMMGLGIDLHHLPLYEGLADAPPNSLGAALQAYYKQNGFPFPGSRKGLPYPYVALHDVHHVIGGYATDPDGELRVLAFTLGLFPDHSLLIGLPPLLQFQMGIADPLAANVAPKLRDQLDAPAFAEGLQRGAAATGPIRNLHWDFWPWIERPLVEVRHELNVL